jgi:hypothetical protein
MTPPILFIIFNRPVLTQKVFEAIREAKPAKLYVAADGPRLGNMTDIEKCRKTRKIIEQIDWHCDKKTLFQNDNFGCSPHIVHSIDWFLDQVNEGVILEDDCLPSLDFFRFCMELLKKYSNDERIMHIGGSNFQYGRKRGNASYYFSKYAHCAGGFATWKRAWKYYASDSVNHEDPWDLVWWNVIEKRGEAITPSVNLISNIGFGDPDSTHTKYSQGKDYLRGNLPTQSLSFPLKHPKEVKLNRLADNFIRYNYLWNGVDKPNRIKPLEDLFLYILGLFPSSFIEKLRIIKRKWLKWY